MLTSLVSDSDFDIKKLLIYAIFWPILTRDRTIRNVIAVFDILYWFVTF